jgi:pyruvate/2-oxoglutarate dehydrogenase complex dihydrolipoamide acyltransferase (E2) component
MPQHADIVVPAFSDSIDEVQIINWLKNEGEEVQFGEPIIELEVNKATVELESPVDGILEAIYCWEGEEIIAGERIGVIRIGSYDDQDEEIPDIDVE